MNKPLTVLSDDQSMKALNYTRLGHTIVYTREARLEPIDALRKTSLDPYSTLRADYRLRLAFEIQNRDSPAGAVAPAGGTGFGQGVMEPR